MKQIVDFAAWKKEIPTTCKTLVFDALQSVARIQRTQKPFFPSQQKVLSTNFLIKKNSRPLGRQSRYGFAIESVSQQTAVFTPQKIKNTLKHIIASDWVVDERYIDKAIDARIASQNLLCAHHPITQKPMLTTPWQLQLESETTVRIEKGKGHNTL